MTNIAAIKNNIVDNIIAVEDDTRQSTRDHLESLGFLCIDDATASPGDSYDPVTNTFIPQAPPSAQIPVYAWYIDTGSFIDRFGAAKMAMLTSQDIVVQAFVKDAMARQWIDLKNPQIAEALTYSKTVVSSLTDELINSILNTPVDPAENLVLRKLYFS